MTDSDKSSDVPMPSDGGIPTSSYSLEQYYREMIERARQGIPAAARELKEAGVASVQISYDGCGDSGQIENITYLDAEGKICSPFGRITITEDQLLDLFYDLTQARHPGWENNDGAFGEFEWDLTADTLHHVHNARYTEYDSTEHEGL